MCNKISSLSLPRFRLLFIGIALFAQLCAISPVCSAETPRSSKEYTFGVFPFLAIPTLEGIFAPIAAELATALGRPVRLQSASSFEKFTDNLSQQQYDIVHIQPFEYVLNGKKSGYIPLATRNEMLKALFAVKPESSIKSARDLKGKVIGLPPKVAAVSYLARIALAESGLKPGRDVTIQYFNTHQSCLQQLLIGKIDSCACGEAILRVFEDQSNVNLRVVLASPEIPQTLFAVHRTVPAAERETIRKTLINSHLNGVDPKLRNLFIKSPGAGRGAYFRSAQDKDFNAVRNYLTLIDKP